jgi:hypothetical protein
MLFTPADHCMLLLNTMCFVSPALDVSSATAALAALLSFLLWLLLLLVLALTQLHLQLLPVAVMMTLPWLVPAAAAHAAAPISLLACCCS